MNSTIQTADPVADLQVLVVEDDADTRENLCDVLSLDGMTVETAGAAAEVLRPRDWTKILAVVLDRKLPDGNATDLLPQIKKLAPQAEVVIVTGYADLDGAIAALRDGATDYILKPVNADALRSCLKRIRARRQAADELRQAQAALAESEQRLRVALANSAIGVCNQDTQLRYTWVYTPWGSLSHEHLIGRTDWEVFEHADAEQLTRLKQRVLNSGSPARQEIALPLDGERRYFQLAVEPHRDALGSLLGLTCVVIDVTDQKRAQERLLQHERLAAIGEAMTGLVHEGRNALQRSRACLELLACEVEDRPEALDLVSRIQNAQEHLEQLYEEVRQYAAPISLKRRPVDVAAVWRETWTNLAHLWQPKQLQLAETAETTPLVVAADDFAIGQVFRNIFENAIDVSPSSGRIAIAAAEIPSHWGKLVRIAIEDQGPGMNREQRERVFEPFFTTKTKGTGLGMAISQRIVESHEGQIMVADRDGPGAQFIIMLPKGVV
jgi:PAS domain S-box-containing protein